MKWTLERLNRWIAPLRQKVAMLLSKAIVDSIDDSTKLQLVKMAILKDETQDGVERVQNYGFTSYPHSGAECLVGFMGGNRDNGIVIAIDDSRYRLNLSEGEVAVYDSKGSKVHLKSDGTIVVDGTKIELGSGVLKKLVTEDFISAFNSHTHPAPGGATSTPTTPVSGKITTKVEAE